MNDAHAQEPLGALVGRALCLSREAIKIECFCTIACERTDTRRMPVHRSTLRQRVRVRGHQARGETRCCVCVAATGRPTTSTCEHTTRNTCQRTPTTRTLQYDDTSCHSLGMVKQTTDLCKGKAWPRVRGGQSSHRATTTIAISSPLPIRHRFFCALTNSVLKASTKNLQHFATLCQCDYDESLIFFLRRVLLVAMLALVVLLAFATAVVGAPYPTPNPIHKAEDGATTVLNSTANGHLLQLESGVSIKVRSLASSKLNNPASLLQLLASQTKRARTT